MILYLNTTFNIIILNTHFAENDSFWIPKNTFVVIVDERLKKYLRL